MMVMTTTMMMMIMIIIKQLDKQLFYNPKLNHIFRLEENDQNMSRVMDQNSLTFVPAGVKQKIFVQVVLVLSWEA